MQISQRWLQKFSSNSLLSICKLNLLFLLCPLIHSGHYLWWKKYLNLQYSLANTGKKQLTTTITKKKKNNYSNNNNCELNKNFWNIAVKCCSLLLFIFVAVFTEKISPEVVKETHMPRSSENEILRSVLNKAVIQVLVQRTAISV